MFDNTGIQLMQKRGVWKYVRVLPVAVLFVMAGASTALAQQSSSDNYQMTETQFGGGSSYESCSGQYCARVSIGDIGDGTTMKTSTAEFSTNTDQDPVIEVIIEPGQSNLGVLSTETTATKTTAIKVRNYTGGGYELQIMGDPPKFGGHTLSTASTPTASRPGTEQFGINLTANTTPIVGSNPVQVPNDDVIFGTAAAEYSTPNYFKYTSGDIIARSQEESGRTDYTVSMIVNISNGTPAGHYTGDFAVIIVPSY
jgi:hypothetical protein